MSYYKFVTTHLPSVVFCITLTDLVNVLSKATIGSFILMNDITINKHTALSANFSSFDGNNKIITIKKT